jgi:hypothetical protein
VRAPARKHHQRAFATAAVFILLLAASALMLTTAATFRQVHRELRFVEKKQIQHWQQRSAVQVTNVSPAAPRP